MDGLCITPVCVLVLLCSCYEIVVCLREKIIVDEAVFESSIHSLCIVWNYSMHCITQNEGIASHEVRITLHCYKSPNWIPEVLSKEFISSHFINNIGKILCEEGEYIFLCLHQVKDLKAGRP